MRPANFAGLMEAPKDSSLRMTAIALSAHPARRNMKPKEVTNMAKDNPNEVEELEDILEDETEETETAEGTRPAALAEELNINPKKLRAYLRREFPRKSDEKNTSWYLTDAQ